MEKNGNGSGPRLPKSTAEKLLQAEGRLARLRAAHSRLEQNRDRYPVGQTQLQLLGGAIRHAERRIAILGETSSRGAC